MTDKDKTDLNVPQNNNKGETLNTNYNTIFNKNHLNGANFRICLRNLGGPMVWKSGGNTQQTEDGEIINDNANESNNMLENSIETLHARMENLFLDENLKKLVFEVTVNNSSSKEESSSSEDNELDDVVVDEKDSELGKDNQTKSQSINCQPMGQSEYMKSVNCGLEQLVHLVEDDSSKEWEEFLQNIHDEEVKIVHTLQTSKSHSDELMAEKIASVSPTDQPNYIVHAIYPPGPPPPGYKRIEVWMPIPNDVLTEEEAKHHPVMKRAKKLIKKGRQADVTFTLNCHYIRHVTY